MSDVNLSNIVEQGKRERDDTYAKTYGTSKTASETGEIGEVSLENVDNEQDSLSEDDFGLEDATVQVDDSQSTRKIDTSKTVNKASDEFETKLDIQDEDIDFNDMLDDLGFKQ